MGALGGIRSLVELPWYARLREVYSEIRARTLDFLVSLGSANLQFIFIIVNGIKNVRIIVVYNRAISSHTTSIGHYSDHPLFYFKRPRGNINDMYIQRTVLNASYVAHKPPII